MRSFSSLDGFVQFLAHRTIALKFNAVVLPKIGKMVQARAREKLGHFQPAVGHFPAWKAPLAPRTQAERLAQGYSANDPLLRSGALRESIKYDVDIPEGKVVIGSDLDKAVWNEIGTSGSPPRPFLGPAAYELKEEIKALVLGAAVSGFTGTSGPLSKVWRRASRFRV